VSQRVPLVFYLLRVSQKCPKMSQMVSQGVSKCPKTQGYSKVVKKCPKWCLKAHQKRSLPKNVPKVSQKCPKCPSVSRKSNGPSNLPCLGYLFVSSTAPHRDAIIADAKEITEIVIDQFLSMVTTIPWMTQDTKAQVQYKGTGRFQNCLV